MTLTDEEKQELRAYCTESNENDVRYKQVIKEKLLENNKLIYLLHNEDLENEDASPDDYLYINILPYYMITPTQTSVKNFLCFEVSSKEVSSKNSVIKDQLVIFYILCHNEDLQETYTSMSRHDLMAALIIDMFQGSNILGNQLKLLSDVASVVDTEYACRTLTFEQQTLNSLGKPGGLRIGN